MEDTPKDFNVTAEVPCHVGAEIPVIPYFRPGSKELAEAVIAAMKEGRGSGRLTCRIQNPRATGTVGPGQTAGGVLPLVPLPAGIHDEGVLPDGQ